MKRIRQKDLLPMLNARGLKMYWHQYFHRWSIIPTNHWNDPYTFTINNERFSNSFNSLRSLYNFLISHSGKIQF